MLSKEHKFKDSNGFIALCRPGFEKALAQEFYRWSGQKGMAGVCRADDRNGFVVFSASMPMDDLAAEAAPSWQRLIFARQVLPWFVQVTDLPAGDRLTPILAAVEQFPPEAVFEGIELAFPDSEAGRPLSRFCRRFEKPLTCALQERERLAPKGNPGEMLYGVFTDWSTVWLCHAPPGLAAPSASGIPRLRMPREAPSRSVLKLAEALLVLLTDKERQRFLKPGMKAVDLGAAPGGWSWQFAQYGIEVTAIDNGRIAPRVTATGMVHPIAADGFKWRPRRSVDWLLCDMVEQPSRIAELMAAWLARGDCRHALFNLKLPMKKRLAAIDDALARLRRRMGSQGGVELRVKHLYHDREEVTVYARALRGARRGRR
ncbi:MAG: 23S rRNA (cytidine(2498)-2'-O)-methyltransferase RlmM [Methylothermaceae bacterium]|nr:23S rRNA (cytidine(2498)-2'-O)-methyltransferase RlmM [Methylothermaceae bacterium]